MRRERRDEYGALVVLVTRDSVPHQVPRDPLARAAALVGDVDALRDESDDALLPDLAQPGKVRGLPEHRRPVELEVVCVDDRAPRGVQDREDRVDDRVLGTHELERQVRGDGVALPGLQGEEFIVHPELLFACNLLPDQFRRIGRADDRGVVAVRQFRYRPDMVQVPVRTDNRLDTPLYRIHDGIIRNGFHLDQIQGMHILDISILVDHHLVEPEAHIKDDNLLSAADGGHISADFVIPAHCYDLNIHVASS